MPISHLLSESFFGESSDPVSNAKTERSTRHSNRGFTRHVQFKEGGEEPEDILNSESTDYLFDDGTNSSLQSYEDDYWASIPGQRNLDEDNNFFSTENYARDQRKKTEDYIDNPVLIDTDGDVCSSWALALALRSGRLSHQGLPKLDIVGITTVNGCTTVENAAFNVCRIVENCVPGTSKIKIFKGMNSPLVTAPGKVMKKPSFFGSDGYGDVKGLPLIRDEKIIRSAHAVTSIIRMAEKYKGKLTIIALGPLTNLAMAVKLNPEIKHYIKEIFIAGGNLEGTGNMTVTSEFNFFIDPEAANVVLESFNMCPVFILPWETCLRSAALSQSFRMNAIGNLGTSEVKLLNKIEQKFLSKQDNQWIVPDAALMACFLNREIIRQTDHYHCTVETQGKHTRGMMVVDKNFMSQRPANVTVISDINRKLLGTMLISGLGEEITGKVPHDQSLFNTENNMTLRQDYF